MLLYRAEGMEERHPVSEAGICVYAAGAAGAQLRLRGVDSAGLGIKGRFFTGCLTQSEVEEDHAVRFEHHVADGREHEKPRGLTEEPQGVNRYATG